MNTEPNILPLHCRMARAALGWSTEDLAKRAGVSANTVSRFENGEADASADSLARIGAAFREAGIRLIDEDDSGGPGVRLNRRTIQIIRRPSWHPGYQRFAFRVAYRSLKVIVFLRREILDDLDRHTGRRTEEEFKASFERSRALILEACEKAIDAGRVEHDDRLYLQHADFPQVVV